MAVYTQLGATALAEIIAAFDVGALVSAKGISEGVSNSNWLIETDRARFILTMYEQRTDVSELPFFLGLLDHLAAHGCPVPRTIHDRAGQSHRFHQGKALALIEFLPGVSVNEPNPAQAHAVGAALARVHLAAADFAGTRSNSLGLADWQALIGACGAQGLASIDPGLAELVTQELAFLTQNWPQDLPRSVIHADLFPDNVLMLGDAVTGLIDFYFACTDITAYDLAITHAAWCFSDGGKRFDPAISQALLSGYQAIRPLAAQERAELPILARGAAMRFLATRSYDWLHTATDAMVTRKDPMAFARRLEFYSSPENAAIFGV